MKSSGADATGCCAYSDNEPTRGIGSRPGVEKILKALFCSKEFRNPAIQFPMKKHLLIISLSIGTLCQAQQMSPQTRAFPSPTAYAIVSRDANSRVWESTSYQVSPSGRTVPQVHHYTELATGLCYNQNGQWLDSQERINILPDGSAEAIQGQHKAWFPGDIYTGYIRLVTPDGKQLQSQPIGLSYDDGINTVLIAELTNSVGELISSNQIIYPNAFAGIRADLLYTYKKSGFEQDVIFRQQLPAPEQFGLNSKPSRLQLITEFFNPPAPVQDVSPGNPQDGLHDTTLTFGKMTMGHGHAFLIGSKGLQSKDNAASVYKSWINVGGRKFLVEELPYRRLSSSLATLPSQSLSTMNSANSILNKVSSVRLLPPARLSVTETNAIQLAKADFGQKPGVVLDYVTINSYETNFTFQGDTTYFVNSYCYYRGTTTFEGGTVVKYDVNGMLELDPNGTINCLTGPYHPAVFTSWNDNSLGESIPGNSGTPNFTDLQQTFLQIDGTNSVVHDCRFCYGFVGIQDGWIATNFFHYSGLPIL
jgi:hypothetical protein